MKCHGCGTAMLLEKSESGATPGSRASIHWRHCPLCGKTRLTSQIDNPADSARPDVGARSAYPAQQASRRGTRRPIPV